MDTATDRESQLLTHAGPQRDLARDGLAYRQGDRPLGLYVVRDGTVLLEHYDAYGNTTAFGVVTPGQFFGYRSYFAGTPHAATARAVEPSTIQLVPRDGVEAFLRTGGEAASRFLLRLVAQDPGPLLAPVLRSPYLPARLRVTYCIMHFAPAPQAAGAAGALVFRLPIGRPDLAAMVALRPETLSRVVTQLARNGGIRIENRKVSVADPAAVYGELAMVMPQATR